MLRLRKWKKNYNGEGYKRMKTKNTSINPNATNNQAFLQTILQYSMTFYTQTSSLPQKVETFEMSCFVQLTIPKSFSTYATLSSKYGSFSNLSKI
jgi:hypothetical protein